MKAALHVTVAAMVAMLALVALAPMADGDTAADFSFPDSKVVDSFKVRVSEDGFKLDGKAAAADEIFYIGAGAYVVANDAGGVPTVSVIKGSLQNFIAALLVPGTEIDATLTDGTVRLSHGVLSWEGTVLGGAHAEGTADVGVMAERAGEGEGTLVAQESPATWGKHDYMAAFAPEWSVVYKGPKLLASQGEVPDLEIETEDGKCTMSWGPDQVIFVSVEEGSWASGIDWAAVAVAAVGAAVALLGFRYHPAIVVIGAAVAALGVLWALGFVDPVDFVDDLLNGGWSL